MKIIFLAGFNLLIFFNCLAQANKKEGTLPDIRSKIITLEDPQIKSITNKNISDIKVIDARPDTSSIGFYKTSTGSYYSIVLKTNVADEVSGFLKDYLDIKSNNDDAGAHIILVIKKLLLTNELEKYTDEKHSKNDNVSWLSGVIARFEFYSNNGNGYSPLYRFDTLLSGTDKIGHPNNYLPDVLLLSIKKLLTSDLKNISPARKKMSLDEIDTYNQRDFNIPIIGAESYNKGVYKTFEEFKNNAPSIANYEVAEDKLTKTIFIKDTAGMYPVRDVWGYCDGQHLYIQSANNYFELVKTENTFICNAAKSISRHRNIKAENVLMLGAFAGSVGKQNKKVTYNLTLTLFHLDMESGELL